MSWLASPWAVKRSLVTPVISSPWVATASPHTYVQVSYAFVTLKVLVKRWNHIVVDLGGCLHDGNGGQAGLAAAAAGPGS